MPQVMAPDGKKEPSRKILALALALIASGVLLLAISIALGSRATLQPVGAGFRTAVPYVFLIGFSLLVVWVVVRPRPEPPSWRVPEPTLFGRETTDFAPPTDRGTLDDPTMPAHRGQHPPAVGWCSRVFEDIEWRRFEAVCQELFAGHAGLEARRQSSSGSVSADLWLHAPGTDAPVGLVRCQYAPGQPVGVDDLREFRTAMASRKLHRGTYATTSPIAAEAQQFARENGITALDVPRLLALIAGRTAAQQHALLRLAYEGEYWRPTCASCGAKMVERPAPSRKRSIWACVNSPRCDFTLPARAAA
jgi:restriction system protein